MSSSAENETHNNGGYTNRGLKKGPWSAEEDEKLKAYVYSLQVQHVTKKRVKNWNLLSKNAGLRRCGKSCRLRWMNHLDKNVKKGPFSKEEERLFFELHAKLGGFKWSKMAVEFPGRSDNAIKNFWSARKRKYTKIGQSPWDPQNSTRHADHVLNVDDSPTPIMAMKECSYIPTMDYPQFSYIQTMVDHPPSSQIPSSEETQYQMLESNFPDNNGSLESIFKIPERGECSYATRSEVNLVDERGKKPISLENHGHLMDNDNWIDSFFSEDYDNNINNMFEKLPNNIKDTLDAVIYGKNFHK